MLKDCFKQFKAESENEMSQLKHKNEQQNQEIKFLQLEIIKNRNEIIETNDKFKLITTSIQTIGNEPSHVDSKINNIHKNKRPAQLLPLLEHRYYTIINPIMR